jgi:hypothetical protein
MNRENREKETNICSKNGQIHSLKHPDIPNRKRMEVVLVGLVTSLRWIFNSFPRASALIPYFFANQLISGFFVDTADLTMGPPNTYLAAHSFIKRAARWISGPSGISLRLLIYLRGDSGCRKHTSTSRHRIGRYIKSILGQINYVANKLK